MGVPMVKRSCCGCSLHTGTLVIGCLYTVWALLELMGYSLMVTLWPLGREGQVSVHKYAFYIAAAAVSGIHMLSSILLIVAAVKLASLTLPWTIVTGIITAIYFVICLTGISLVLQDTGETLVLEIIVICACLARLCISVYCIVVVHSRHKQLMEDEHEVRFQHSGRVYKAVEWDKTNGTGNEPL
ncbi:unnamed protein product [Diatraea saccharalis]|uniref:Uncharacterized protein n=1 Tax=Diatraea saccharalis TaxID=40085 RepID=A0A9P0C9Z5_9NEOP|nr:unnamed protein product [Diatraea saccharalis]